MDSWGLFWLLFSIIVFPFGYKPIVALLSVSSIFQASKLLTIGGVNLPIFFCMEIICFIRLLIPYKGSGLIKFNTKIFLHIINFIFLIFLHGFFVTTIFDDIKVFSPRNGFEYNYQIGGENIRYTMSNISQSILLSIHLLLLYVFYMRRKVISKDFYIKTLFFSIIIFVLFSCVWKFNRDIYNFLAIFFMNNDQYSITAIYENRLSGTFSEPSYAGLFICTLIFPMFLAKNNYYKLSAVILLYMAYLNLSGTLIVGLLCSIFLVFFIYFKNYYMKIISLFLIILSIIPIFLIYSDLFLEAYFNKNVSVSGVVRSASNINGIEALLHSYFIGIGVGSIRASSMFINMISSLGIFLFIYILFIVIKCLSIDKGKYSINLLLMVILAFVASWSAIPDYTMGFLWNLIFANSLLSFEYNKDKINKF